MMFNPGGLGSMLAQQSSMPDDEFARSAEQSMLRTGKTPITMLADLARRITARKSAMTQQGLQAGAQMRSQPPTLKDQLELEALSLGIGSQPYGYAGGGLVAFDLGGKTEEKPLTAADIEGADLKDAMAEAASEVPNFKQLDRLQAQYNMLQQQLAAANRSRDPKAVEYYVAQLKNAKDALDAAIVSSRSPQRIESFVRPPAPEVDPSAGTAAMSRSNAPGQGNTAPAVATRSLNTSGANPSAGARPGTSAGTRSGANTNAGTRPGAGAGAGSDTGIRPVMPSPAATAADIAAYLAQGQEAIGKMQGRGKVTPAELALRETLLKAQEAEREPRVEYKEPEGMTPRELLQLASFDTTKGRWMGSLAEKAAGVMTAREAKAEEFRKLNREIDIANRRLNTALAQQRLAYATSDRQAQEAADLAVANAKLALREKVIDFGLKSRTAVVQEREAGAKETAAGAAVTSAEASKLQAGEAQKFREKKELGDAIQDAKKEINNQSMIAGPRRAEYMRADEAGKAKMIEDEQVKYVIERAGMFATEAEIRKQMKAGQGTAPAAGTQILKFDKAGKPIP